MSSSPGSPLSPPSETEILNLLFILEGYVPYSLPLYRRLQLYLIQPSHPTQPLPAQIFQASANESGGYETTGEGGGNIEAELQNEVVDGEWSQIQIPWLAAHVDLSRAGETQVWIFANWECTGHEDDRSTQSKLLPGHEGIKARQSLVRSLFRFIYDRCVPFMPFTAPTSFECVEKMRGIHHPYSPSAVLIGSCNLRIRSLIPDLAVGKVESHCVKYIFTSSCHEDTSSGPIPHSQEDLPPGYRFGALRQPRDLQSALDRTDIPRTLKTMSLLPSRAIFYEKEPIPVAWGFVGIDASLTTLHTEPQHRRKNLAVAMSAELLRIQAERFEKTFAVVDRYSRVGGGSKWGHADVLEHNKASRRVMEKAGGKVMWNNCWVEVELERLFGDGGIWSDA